MSKLSKINQRMLRSIELGYHVVDGKVISPHRPEPLKIRKDKHGYEVFTFDGNPVYVHRVVAYQKYGNKIFQDGVEVRHRDGNSTNNLEYNILIGSHTDNMNDVPKKVRTKSSIKAATTIRKFSDIEMEEIRNFHNGSYKETMERFNISSKATLHRILNITYVTKL